MPDDPKRRIAEELDKFTPEQKLNFVKWMNDLIMDDCDHDWEDIGMGRKQCTYPACQKVEDI